MSVTDLQETDVSNPRRGIMQGTDFPVARNADRDLIFDSSWVTVRRPRNVERVHANPCALAEDVVVVDVLAVVLKSEHMLIDRNVVDVEDCLTSGLGSLVEDLLLLLSSSTSCRVWFEPVCTVGLCPGGV